MVRGAWQVAGGAALFGLIPVFVQRCGEMSVWTMVSGRAAAAVLFAAIYLYFRKCSLRIPRQLLVHYFTWSLTLAAAMVCYVFSVRLSGMAVAGTLLGLQPLAIAGCAFLFFREKINRRTLLSGTIALAGVALLASKPGNGTGAAGILFGLLTAILLAFNFTYHLRFLPGEHPARLVFIQNLLQLPLLLIPAIIDPGVITVQGAAGVTAMGLICTLFAYALIYHGSRSVSKQQIGILQLTENFIPLFVGIIFFGEKITPAGGAGVILVFVAVFVVAGNQRKTVAANQINRPQRV